MYGGGKNLITVYLLKIDIKKKAKTMATTVSQ